MFWDTSYSSLRFLFKYFCVAFQQASELLPSKSLSAFSALVWPENLKSIKFYQNIIKDISVSFNG